jgi:hypothetical protein
MLHLLDAMEPMGSLGYLSLGYTLHKRHGFAPSVCEHDGGIIKWASVANPRASGT